MKSIAICIISLLVIIQVANAQKDSLIVRRIDKTSNNYTSYVQVKSRIFAITDSGQLVIWDLVKLDTVGFSHNDAKIKYTAIAKDQANNIFIGANDGSIFKLTSADLSFSLHLKIKF